MVKFVQLFDLLSSGESAEGATVTTVGPIISASETSGSADLAGPWNTFQLTSGGTVSESINGGAATIVGGSVISLVYHNHTCWQKTSDATFTWYYYSTTAGWTYYQITAIALSANTVAHGAAAGTTVGTISTTITDGSTFAGTYSLSGTNAASFSVTGNALKTVGALADGQYTFYITATFTAIVGSAYTSAQAFSVTVGTGAVFPNNPPAQATAAGFTTLSFFDDFTTNTITGNGSFTTPQSGINWYPGLNITTNVDPTNYHLMTAATAGTFGNGSSGAGPNASPNGGIVQIFGNSANTQQSTFYNRPAGDLTNDGCFGPTGYWEAYVQTSNQAQDHMGWWTLPIGWANSTEIDTLETGPAWNGKWGQCDMNEWVGGNLTASTTEFSVAYDSNWHTFGMLIEYNTGSTTVGAVYVYLDNVLVNTIPVGTGTTWAQALLYTRYMLMGKDYAAGRSINFDWIKVWS